jgi:hypothetical protein
MDMSPKRVKEIAAATGLAASHAELDPKYSAFRLLRDQIVVQHDHLRAQLEHLDAEAAEAIRADSRVPCDLPGKLDGLVRALYEHMDFEEHAIAADLVAKELWGARSAAILLQEHGRQREELARLTREASASDDRISLSLAIRSFASDVLLDLTLEERRFFSVSL